MKKTSSGYKDIDEFRLYLAIDKDDLEGCLEQHAELFYHVAEATAIALADRDEARSDLELEEAEVGLNLRSASDKRLTEKELDRRVRLDDRIRKRRKEHLETKAYAEAWTAMKEAFQQRSFMLGKLVDMRLKQHQALALEHGARVGRDELVRQRVATARSKPTR